MKLNSTPLPTHQQIIDIEHRVFHPRFSDTEEIRKALANRGRMAQYFPRICPGCEQSFLVYGEQLATTPRDVFCTSQCEKASKEAWRIKQRQAIRAEMSGERGARRGCGGGSGLKGDRTQRGSPGYRARTARAGPARC
jgi:hypothetical protein